MEHEEEKAILLIYRSNTHANIVLNIIFSSINIFILPNA